MAKLSVMELARRVMWKGYFSLDSKKKLEKFAFVWVDRDRRSFISNTSFLKPGMPYARDRIRQLDDGPNADPVCVEFDINKSRVSEGYYSRNLNIDERNRTRKSYFQLDRKLQTKDWSIRFNTSILVMNDVNT